MTTMLLPDDRAEAWREAHECREGGALLRAILEEPGDDGLRLIYADWLEDAGFAEEGRRLRDGVIRGGAEVEQEQPVLFLMGPPPAPGSGPAPVPEGTVVYRRGMVDEVWLSPDAFLLKAQPLFSLFPITRVVLLGRKPREDSLAEGDPGPALFYWRSRRPQGMSEMTNDVPGELRPFLTATSMYMNERFEYHDYAGEEAALAGLSAACVAYGRKLAGLQSPLEKKGG